MPRQNAPIKLDEEIWTEIMEVCRKTSRELQQYTRKDVFIEIATGQNMVYWPYASLF